MTLKVSDRLCECGCGKNTNFYKGKPSRFIQWHNSRGKNNHWYGKHFSEEHRRKIREGNIGRKHTKQELEKMRKANSGENNAMYGKRHTEETKRKNIVGICMPLLLGI